ncbi:hypothetical protein ACO1O0_006140 [Amphichorda felina]
MAFTGKAWQFSALHGHLEDSLTATDAAPLPSEASPPRPGHVVVEVLYAALNPVDYKLVETPLVGRLAIPRPATPGLDLCGRVVASGSPEFAEGQLVFGRVPSAASSRGMGTLRRYAVLPASGLAPLPGGVDPEQAAAVGTAGTSAYLSLMPEKLRQQSGAKVFINGGSGGVGTWAVQLAKALGAYVVTTCSTRNVELCRGLGADEVVDYRVVDVVDGYLKKQPEGGFDLVIDNVGSETDRLYAASRHVLKPGATFVQVGVGAGMSLGTMASMTKRMVWPPSFLGGGAPKFYFVNMDNSAKLLKPIGDLMAEGKVRAVIDKTYAWDDVPAAYRHLREGHARGKIVVKVGEE